MKTSLKSLVVVAGILSCAILSSGAMAFDVVSDSSDQFSLMGPVDNFTNWAVTGGATNSGFETFKTPLSNNQWMSGTQATEKWVNIVIPFNFSAPIETARLDYGAVVINYGNNYGHVMLDVEVNGTWTNIFHAVANAGETPYNYTTSQTPDKPAGSWRGYTDISDLVKGQNSFNLRATVYTGWQAWVYNGGEFLPDSWADSNFYLTGTTAPAVPEPSALVAMCTGIIGLAGFSSRRRK